jgi:hypothetical protein
VVSARVAGWIARKACEKVARIYITVNNYYLVVSFE